MAFAKKRPLKMIISKIGLCKLTTLKTSFRRGDQVVYGAALEKRSPIIRSVGSNPTLSAEEELNDQ